MAHDHTIGDEQCKVVEGMAPREWDSKPLQLAHKIRDVLKPLSDADKGIDSGGGDGLADLWLWYGGREYHIAIKPSLPQIKRESN